MQNQLDDTSKREWDLAILTGLTLLALATRSYGIAEWDLVQDEVFTVTRAAERYTSLRNPAYYVLVMGSFKLFGVSEWAARLPAMLLGILSVPVFYVTCRSVLGRNVALIGALLIIFSSWHLWYSQFSRFYAGVFLFGLLSYFLYYKAIRLGNPGYLAWAMLASMSAFQTAFAKWGSRPSFPACAITLSRTSCIRVSSRTKDRSCLIRAADST